MSFDPESPPELSVTRWFNTDVPLTLGALRGRVVVLTAFQMLCPGCIEHGLPQARRIRRRFREAEVALIGLHTVFEHHAVMTPDALAAFLHEYRWPFPVGVDAADGAGPPRTMAAYHMQGTPTLLLFDRRGRLRRHYFGHADDMLLAAEIMALATEDADGPRDEAVAIERKLAAALAAEHEPAAVGPHAHGDHHACDHDGCDHDHAGVSMSTDGSR